MLKSSSITDTPISSIEQDTLRMKKYALSLARFITISDTPITIGLQGEWGTGKTSLMSMIKNSFDNNNIAYSWVNTWEFSLFNSTESTTPAILTGMLNDLKDSCKARGLWTLSDEAKEKYSKAVRFLGALANQVVASQTGIDAKGALSTTQKSEAGKSEVAEMKASIGGLINDLINDPKNPVNKIVFFVDDLDRIPPNDAVEVLEALKNIFDLPHCIFILAIDYDVVVKGLEGKFGKKTQENAREFRSFFDKIIQVPFTMPTGAYDVQAFLKEKIEILQLDVKKDQLEHLNKIARLTVGNNPRSLKRYLNSFSLINVVLSDDEDSDTENNVNITLLFAVLGIQISYPQIFRLLTMNHMYINWTKEFAQKVDIDIEKVEDDLKKYGESELTDEIWEKLVWGVCQKDSFLKTKAFQILELLNFLRDIIDDKVFSVDLESAMGFAAITNVDDNLEVKALTTKGNVTYFAGFEGWINEMRTGQEENKQLGLKKRNPFEISNDVEDYLKYWNDYFESEGFEMTHTPTGGCSVVYKKKIIARFAPKKSKTDRIELHILRSFKRNYYRAAIEGLECGNFRKYAPLEGKSYTLPWGKELFYILGDINTMMLHENELKELVKEASETIDADKRLKVNMDNHHILEEIFNGSFNL
jgi:hypothetical protein